MHYILATVEPLLKQINLKRYVNDRKLFFQ